MGTGIDARVFHVVNMEPFRTWDNGVVLNFGPDDQPLDVPGDTTLGFAGGSCQAEPVVSSCGPPVDGVYNLLESDVTVSLSDLFDEVTEDVESVSADPVVSCDGHKGGHDGLRYDLRPRLTPRITSGWETNKWTNVFHSERLNLK